MVPRDVEKTAFRTPIGNFYYTVMPIGLKNTGTTYQCTMTTIFHNMTHCELEDYVDDIVVKSRRREDHVKELRKVFENEAAQVCFQSVYQEILGVLGPQ